ncbi:hypothetical protein NH340_JMT08069 [Sarcoptes scabiei]|nr:hypothetical protein NH340_JMT08069 [Sarcoptes scabiei]
MENSKNFQKTLSIDHCLNQKSKEIGKNYQNFSIGFENGQVGIGKEKNQKKKKRERGKTSIFCVFTLTHTQMLVMELVPDFNLISSLNGHRFFPGQIKFHSERFRKEIKKTNSFEFFLSFLSRPLIVSILSITISFQIYSNNRFKVFSKV